LIARQIQLDAISHNIANASTTGFRETSPFFRTFNRALEQGPANPLNNAANNQPVAAGVFHHDRQGSIKQTGNPLDVAIDGEGFFKVNTPFGARYTRNGNFTMDAAGRLVTAAGYQVLDSNDQPLFLTGELEQFHIKQNGTIVQEGGVVGRLKLVTFPDNDLMIAEEDTLLAMQDPTAVEQLAPGRIVGAALENSNVGVAKQMIDMISAHRAYEASARMVRTIDTVMNDGVIRTYGPRA
jgi:flagellar basal body rod protein FlgG